MYNINNVSDEYLLEILQTQTFDQIIAPYKDKSTLFHIICRFCNNETIVDTICKRIENNNYIQILTQKNINNLIGLDYAIIYNNINIIKYLMKFYKKQLPDLFKNHDRLSESFLSRAYDRCFTDYKIDKSGYEIFDYILNIYIQQNLDIVIKSQIFHDICVRQDEYWFDYFINLVQNHSKYNDKLFDIFIQRDDVGNVPLYYLLLNPDDNIIIVITDINYNMINKYLKIIKQHHLENIFTMINTIEHTLFYNLYDNTKITHELKNKYYDKIINIICQSPNKIKLIDDLLIIEQNYHQLDNYILNKITDIKNSSIKAA